jgi:hypothetical protein
VKVDPSPLAEPGLPPDVELPGNPCDYSSTAEMAAALGKPVRDGFPDVHVRRPSTYLSSFSVTCSWGSEEGGANGATALMFSWYTDPASRASGDLCTHTSQPVLPIPGLPDGSCAVLDKTGTLGFIQLRVHQDGLADVSISVDRQSKHAPAIKGEDLVALASAVAGRL